MKTTFTLIAALILLSVAFASGYRTGKESRYKLTDTTRKGSSVKHGLMIR